MEVVDARDGSMVELSPLFHYFTARQSRRHLGNVTLRRALAAAARYGICLAQQHAPAMDRAGALARPARAAFSDASQQRVVAYDSRVGRLRYYRLDRGDRAQKWRAAIAAGLPVIFGFHTTSLYWQGRGIPSVPGEASRGGHAALVIGFDDQRSAFLVRDSRGSEFANSGEWLLGYSVSRSALIVESWILEALSYDA
jgi:hypothetical protein